MSTFSNPSTTIEGLTLYYDMNNINTYSGPPIINLAKTITFVGQGTKTGYSCTSSSSTENVPGIGYTTVYNSYIQNNYVSFTPNSDACCPHLFSWGPADVKPSTKYTYGIVYRVLSGYTNQNYMYRYEYTASGGSYVTQGGVFSNAKVKPLGDGWYYCLGTFTTRSTTNYLSTCGAWYYQYAQEVDTLSVAKVLIAEGDWSTMHPAYWPPNGETDYTSWITYDGSGNPTNIIYTEVSVPDAVGKYVVAPYGSSFNYQLGTKVVSSDVGSGPDWSGYYKYILNANALSPNGEGAQWSAAFNTRFYKASTGISNLISPSTSEAIGSVGFDDGSINYKPYFKGPSNFNYLYTTESNSHTPGKSFTYEAWVKINSDTGVDKIIVGKPGGHVGLMTWNNRFYFRLSAGNTFKDLSVANSNGTWYHLVGVYIDNIGSFLYANGELVESVSFTTALNDYGTILHIGGNLGVNASYSLDANIDIIKVYNRSLTSDEVKQNFYAQRSRFGL